MKVEVTKESLPAIIQSLIQSTREAFASTKESNYYSNDSHQVYVTSGHDQEFPWESPPSLQRQFQAVSNKHVIVMLVCTFFICPLYSKH